MSFWQWVKTEAGLVQVNINAVAAKIVSGAQLAAHEADAFIHWIVGQAPTVAADLQEALPLVQAASAAAASMGPEGAAAAAVIDTAVTAANIAVQGLNAAAAQMHASQNAGQSGTVADGATLLAGYKAVQAATQALAAAKVAAVSTPAAPAPVAAPAQ